MVYNSSTTVDTNATAALALSWLPAKMSEFSLCDVNCRSSIDPFSVSKYCDVFLWAELSWRQKDSPDRFTNTSYEVC